MNRIPRLTDVRTIHFAWAAIAAMVLGSALDYVTGPLWVHFGLHAIALEYIGGGLAVLGYWMLWLLLPISAFRPERRFYTKGDCALRELRCWQVFGLLLLVHIALIALMAAIFVF